MSTRLLVMMCRRAGPLAFPCFAFTGCACAPLLRAACTLVLLSTLSSCATGAHRYQPDYPDLHSTVKPVVAVAGTVTALDENHGRQLRVAIQVDTTIVGIAPATLEFGARWRFNRYDEGCARGLSGDSESRDIAFQVGDTLVVILAPPDSTNSGAAWRGEQDLYEFLDAFWVDHALQELDQPVFRQVKADFRRGFIDCEGEPLSTAALYARVIRTWQQHERSLGALEADIYDFYKNRRRWRMAGEYWHWYGRMERP